MTDSTLIPQTHDLNPRVDYHAPDGSEIRLLPTMKGGGLCHCTLPAQMVTIAVAHHRVEEIWYFLEGTGEVWRAGSEGSGTVVAHPGMCLTIPPRTQFQFRNTGGGPLRTLIVTMPPWPGPDEAYPAAGPWRRTVGERAD